MKTAAFFLVLLLTAGCGSVDVSDSAGDDSDDGDTTPGKPAEEPEEEEEEEEQEEPGPEPEEPEPEPLFKDLGASDDHGDIEISFIANWDEDVHKNVTLSYRGGCNSGDFEQALISEDLSKTAGGENSTVWHSWDQEAGCSGMISFKLSVEEGGEVFSDVLDLYNQGRRSGFVNFEQYAQGVLPTQMDAYQEALDLLLPHPGTAFVAARIGDIYEVRGPGGWIAYTREQTNEGYVYEIVDGEGDNPIANQDPTSFNTYEDELAWGSNPLGTSIPDHDYEADDPRLSFIEPEDDVYPFGYERIAAFFDNPNAPDLYVNPRSYTHAGSGNIGTHGSLNMVQSRAPLLIMGKGVKRGVVLEEPVRTVDIAPTVAALLGFPRIKGVDHRGIRSAFNYLKWQDGKPIESILTGEVAKHAIIVISDGLNKTQLDYLMNQETSATSAFRRMKNHGVYGRYGTISNFPSNTWPGHNEVGSGLYSGHHGILDNAYYLRNLREKVSFAGQLIFGAVDSSYFEPIEPPGGETLHQAVKRVFGTWEEGSDEGGYTMSVFSPSVEGADTSDLKAKDRSGKIIDWSTLTAAAGTLTPNIPPWMSYKALGTQQAEALLMEQIRIIFGSGPNPVPNYAIINFMTSDTAGHDKGPHHEIMGLVVEHMNHNMNLLFNWLAGWEIMDDTVIIFTADHGMQLGDPPRGANPLNALESASFEYHSDTNYSIYFK